MTRHVVSFVFRFERWSLLRLKTINTITRKAIHGRGHGQNTSQTDPRPMHLRFPPRLIIPWTYARNYTIDQNLIRCCGFRWQSGFGWSQDLISIWHDEVLWIAETPWVDRKLGVEFGIFNICYLDVLEKERLAGRFGC